METSIPPIAEQAVMPTHQQQFCVLFLGQELALRGCQSKEIAREIRHRDEQAASNTGSRPCYSKNGCQFCASERLFREVNLSTFRQVKVKMAVDREEDAVSAHRSGVSKTAMVFSRKTACHRSAAWPAQTVR